MHWQFSAEMMMSALMSRNARACPLGHSAAADCGINLICDFQ